jgi:hypothetical protein
VVSEAGSQQLPGGHTDPDYGEDAGRGGNAGDGEQWPGGDWQPKGGLSGRAVWKFQ